MDLFERRYALFTGRSGDGRVLQREVELGCVRISDVLPKARLPRKPFEEGFQGSERVSKGRLAQALARTLAYLRGKLPLEGGRLFEMKGSEALPAGVSLKARNSCRGGVDRGFAEALRLLQESEVVAFRSLVFWVVVFHFATISSKSLFAEGSPVSLMLRGASVNVTFN